MDPNRHFLLVANWKMYLSFEQAIDWAETHYASLYAVANNKKLSLIICPSFEALYAVQRNMHNLPLQLGAQDCAGTPLGPYTGQVSATSLKQLGCHYCIIGHSEARSAMHQSTKYIGNKLEQLLLNAIIPITCVGETALDREQGATTSVLENQLAPLLQNLSSSPNTQTLIIAYEPVWAIGSGSTPTAKEIDLVFKHIKRLAYRYAPSHRIRLLYGGSISEKTLPPLIGIESLEGFLIGKASTDFQELKKIVDLL